LFPEIPHHNTVMEFHKNRNSPGFSLAEHFNRQSNAKQALVTDKHEYQPLFEIAKPDQQESTILSRDTGTFRLGP
jgi:hypothetical protein